MPKKRYDCEECARSVKGVSIVKYNDKKICKRCYNKSTTFAGWKRADIAANKEWKAKHKRKAITYNEKGVLIQQWKKEGLSDSQIKTRLMDLRSTVLINNKKICMEQKEKEKKILFKDKFEQMILGEQK